MQEVLHKSLLHSSYSRRSRSMRVLVLLALCSVCASVAAEGEGWMVCYFSSWAVYRPDDGMFDVDNIDPFLCTHAIFGFAGLSNQTWTIEVLDPWNENCPDDEPPGDHCAYERFVALKETNPNLKVILAVGGWNEGSEDYSVMVADPEKRATFIQSCLELVQKEGFDGLDIDWEYPTQRGGAPEDKENFVLLLDEIRAEFDKYGLIMTAALASGKPTIDLAYDVEGLIRNLDVFSIMTYDYHGAWENFTHHNAPLCGYPTDEGEFVWFNVKASIDYWLSLGIPPEKTVMGIPLYGRCFTLDDIDDHGMLADASEPGPPGPYTRLRGTLGYNEICERLQNGSDCTVVHDPYLNEPYMYCESDWIWCGYDDPDSVFLKARLAKNRNLAGTMVWTIDTDDFVPNCGSTKFVLMQSVLDAFSQPANSSEPDCPNTGVIPTTPTTTEETTTEPTTAKPTTPETTTPEPTTTEPTTTPTTTTPEPTTPTTTPEPTTVEVTTPEPTPTPTPSEGPSVTPPIIVYPLPPDCDENPDQEFYPHEDCNKYWWCVDGSPILMLCSPGTVFNPATNRCDYEDEVNTSHCRLWACEVDGVVYPGVDCDQYFECEHGQPVEKECAEGTYFNPDTGLCDNPVNVDTSACNVPEGEFEDEEDDK